MERLLLLLVRLQAKGVCTTDDLTGLLGVSRRTIFRDLGCLRRVGVPVCYDKKNSTYKISVGFFLPPTNLDVGEAWSLLLAAKLGESSLHPNPSAATRGAHKLALSLPSDVRTRCDALLRHVEIRLPAMADGTQVKELVLMLASACTLRQCLRISYDGPEDVPRVFVFRPYKVAFLYTEWFVVGYLVAKRTTLLIRAACIDSASPTGATFETGGSFRLDRFLGNAWRTQPERTVHHVALRFDPAAAEEVESIHWHKSQHTQRESDGSVVFEVDVDGLGEIARWIMSFGEDVEVLKPAELRHRIQRTARRVLSMGSEIERETSCFPATDNAEAAAST